MTYGKRCALAVIALGAVLSAPALAHADVEITTTAAPVTGTILGQLKLTDTAMVTGRTGPQQDATVDFMLYSPAAPTCLGIPVFAQLDVPYPASGSVPVTTMDVTPSLAGTYRWIARYKDSTGTVLASGMCGDAGEQTVVGKATPALTTSVGPSSSVELTDALRLTDSATVSGRVSALASTLDFALYGPDHPDCTGQPVHEALDVPYSAAEPPPTVVTPPDFQPTKAGTYRWVATYKGDVNNAAVTSACGEASETIVVRPHVAGLMTTVPAAFTIGSGQQLTATATVTGRIGAQNNATLDFRLYGPKAPGCVGTPVFEDLDVDYHAATTTKTSGSYVPPVAGTYRWRISYSGDDNNAPIAQTCGEATLAVVNQASPALTFSPSATITVGFGALSDGVTVAHVLPLGGSSIDFDLYGPTDPTCTGAVVFPHHSISVPASGTVSTLPSSFTPTKAGTYRWKITYSGDDNNNPLTLCSALNETIVKKRVPAIATTASDPVALGAGTLTADATLTGAQQPTGGTITFKLYGPLDPTCAGTGLPGSSSTKNAPPAGGAVTSAPYQPHAPGTYRWIATYSSDDNNEGVASLCTAAPASTVVDRAQPTIATVASASLPLGSGTLSDSATIEGEFEPDGNATIDFTLYGPNDATCSGTPAFIALDVPYPVKGATVTSMAFKPTQAGIYRWKATYSGDANNKPDDDVCPNASETTVISKATPTLATVASPDMLLAGASLTASVTVSGRESARPTAKIHFELFGPDDATCSGPAATPPADVPYPETGAPSVTSAAFTPNRAGTYRWKASYTGDANNAAVDGACNGPKQNVVVGGVTAKLKTTASPAIVLGAGTLTDQATLDGRSKPLEGATIDFKLYGPDDAGCSAAPVFQSLAVPYPVADGPVKSTAFTPYRAGTYRWVATYSGEKNNLKVDGACNDAGEAVTVARNTPTLTLTPSPTITLGTGAITDTVSVNGRLNPGDGGIVDLRAYAPTDPTCSRPAVFESLGLAYPASGGPLTSAAFAPTRAGTYRWVAWYRGDANNVGVVSACGTPNGTTVAPGPSRQPQPNRAQTKQVTARTTPRHDATKLYTFTTTGRVTPPPSCAPEAVPDEVGSNCVLPICPANSIDPRDCTLASRALLCSTGRVTIRFLRIAYTVSSRNVGISRHCTFRSKVSLKTSSPFRRGALTVRVRFEGNPFLLPRSAPKQLVSAG